jgi:hypothetical protein
LDRDCGHFAHDHDLSGFHQCGRQKLRTDALRKQLLLHCRSCKRASSTPQQRKKAREAMQRKEKPLKSIGSAAVF